MFLEPHLQGPPSRQFTGYGTMDAALQRIIERHLQEQRRAEIARLLGRPSGVTRLRVRVSAWMLGIGKRLAGEGTVDVTSPGNAPSTRLRMN